MAKKKGLGQDVEKSIKVMDELLDILAKFHSIPIKKGLKSNGVVDEKFSKVVNETKEQAYSLNIAVEDLLEQVKGVKPQANKRFAAQRIITKFLEQNQL